MKLKRALEIIEDGDVLHRKARAEMEARLRRCLRADKERQAIQHILTVDSAIKNTRKKTLDKK